MNNDDLRTALSRGTVLVVGDVMLDRFVTGVVDRVSQEAPVPVLMVQDETTCLGGAGNVARNIAALSGRAILVGVVGHDAAGTHIVDTLCPDAGIDARLVRSGNYSTCVKTRFVCDNRPMLRVDSEQTAVDGATLRGVLSAVREPLGGVDVMILSDYAKGVLTPGTIREHIETAHAAGVPVFVDPKSGDLSVYRHADLITPNAPEAAAATGYDCWTDSGAGRAAEAIATMCDISTVLVTRGAHGMTLLAPRYGVESPLHLPPRGSSVCDVSGAGDTVIATLALALSAGIEVTRSAQLANAAAGIAVGRFGTTAVNRGELLQAFSGTEYSLPMTAEHAVSEVRRWQDEGLTVGFANGCFDLVHPGHVALLAEARTRCDRLVVALNTDASVKRLKGEGRPVQDLLSRAAVIGSLRSVDLVTTFDQDTPAELISALKPNVLIKGADYRIDEVVGREMIEQWGGRVCLIPVQRGHSTSNIISRLEQPVE